MKSLFLFIVINGVATLLPGQYIERTVIGSSGNYQSNLAVGNLHWTIGEMMVQEFHNGQALSQGFHLGINKVISAIDWETNNFLKIRIFPNPTAGWLLVESDIPGSIEVVLMDLYGRPLRRHTMEHTRKAIDLRQITSGIYLLNVNINGYSKGTFRILKVDN